jgi:hypothetical protein
MSGPKLSDFELKEQIAKRLEEERRKKLEEFKQAVNFYNSTKKEIESRFDTTLFEMRKLLKNIHQYDELFSVESSIRVKVERFSKKMNDTFGNYQLNGDDSVVIRNKANLLKDDCNKIFYSLEMEVSDDVKRYQDYVSKQYKLSEEKAQKKFFAQQEVQSVVNISFSKNNTEEDSLLSTVHNIQKLLNTPGLTIDDRIYLSKIFNNLNSNLDETGKKVTIKAFHNYKGKIQSTVLKFDKLYNNYMAQVSLYNSIGEPTMMCRAISSFKDLDELHSANNQLERNIVKKSEAKFIYEQLNEAFKERGYSDLVNFVINENDQGFHFLAMIDSEKKVGLHVYTSGTNSIMIETVKSELVVRDDPDVDFITNDDLLPQEQEELFQQQVLFCEAHKELLQDLSKRGLILSENQYYEPNRMHAKKIQISVDQKSFDKLQKNQNKRKASNRQKEKERAIK